MLKYFEVSGFKNFTNSIKLDFADVRDYQFSPRCIQNDMLGKLIVYGKNSVGKSNFGLALFDITTHLTDNNVSPNLYDNYLSADSTTGVAEFSYTFQFDSLEIQYKYSKKDMRQLVYEEVLSNGLLLFSYNYETGKKNLDWLKQYVPSLNFEFLNKDMSVLRYIVNNATNPEIEGLKKLVRFVSHMLWFRSLDENRYIGYKTSSTDYLTFIFEDKNLQEFQELLHRSGVNEDLIVIKNPSGDNVLYFKKKKPLPFLKVASNGTKALYTLFYWLKTSSDLSFLFIDEFDAYYHVELSESIVELLENYSDFQTILTSHNTNLLSNRIMRPDCYFILTPGKLVSFANATGRELREGHNLEKLYISGEFNE